ncbi:importin subunit beta-1 [Enteropsectra breve]|nr:importin subunit beta-1 [Enteropsectra breve]
METAELEKILANALNSSEIIRNDAEDRVHKTMNENYMGFYCSMIEIILDCSKDLRVRHVAVIILKNSLNSTNKQQQKVVDSAWLSYPKAQRAEIFKKTLHGLALEEKQLKNNFSKLVGSIVRIETNYEKSAVPFLLEIGSHLSKDKYVEGVLLAIGEICDQIYKYTQYVFTEEEQDYIYRILMFYNSAATSSVVLLETALMALSGSIAVLGDILTDKRELPRFIESIISCKDKNDETLMQASLNVLVKLVSDAPSALKEYGDILCIHFLNFCNYDSEDIKLVIFEFWTILSEIGAKKLVTKYLSHVLQFIFSNLEYEDATTLGWTLHKAAAALLVSFNDDLNIQVLDNEISRDFIAGGFASKSTEKRALAALALGCAIRSPCPEYANRISNILISDIDDPVCANMALYAIARVCEKDIGIIAQSLPDIFMKCGIAISSNSVHTENALWVYSAIIGDAHSMSSRSLSSPIEFHYIELLSTMVNRLVGLKHHEQNIRNAIISTLTELVAFNSEGHQEILQNLCIFLEQKLAELLELTETADKNTLLYLDAVISGYIVLAVEVMNNLQSFSSSKATELFYKILKAKEGSFRGEVYIAISNLLNKFTENIECIVPFVLRDILSGDAFVSSSALNAVSELAVKLECKFTKYLEDAIGVLIDVVASDDMERELKSEAIQAFGDVALSVGRGFDPYFEMTLILVSQTVSLNRNGDEEFVDELRRATVKLLSCILIALKSSTVLKAHLENIMINVQKILYEDKAQVYVKESVDLLFDIKNIFGLQALDREWARLFLQYSSESSDIEAKNTSLMLLKSLY